jgi:cell division protein FtsX
VSAIWLARQVRRQVQAHRWVVLATCGAFFLLALVVGGARLGARTVARWGSVIGQNIHVIVYLADEADQDRAQELAEILRHVPTVAQVASVEPSTALARFSASASAFGLDNKALDGLEPAYFPRSIEISLIPAADLSERAADLAKRLRGVPGVLQVDAMGNGLARLAVWVKVGRRLGVVVLVSLALVTLGILMAVFLRSRGAVAMRAAVLGQLGETAAGVRLPVGLWTAAAAVVGGGLGAIVLRLGWQSLVGRLERSLGIVTGLPLPFLDPGEIAAGLAVVLLVGLAMGYLATPLPWTQDRA